MNISTTLESCNSTATALESVVSDELQQFLQSWDHNYKSRVKSIDLFDTDITAKYSDSQKEIFARTFYHIRGHFHKFLWLLGNQAPSQQAKQQILHNIEEEFGGDHPSHERLYFDFSDSLGFDITDEFITEAHHLPFIKEFNLKHLEWLNDTDWPGMWSAFSAYERLDNIDYSNLFKLASSIGAKGAGLTFFIVHNSADHFDRTYCTLKDIWNSEKNKVKDAFNFIANHQVAMWELLSKAIYQQ